MSAHRIGFVAKRSLKTPRTVTGKSAQGHRSSPVDGGVEFVSSQQKAARPLAKSADASFMKFTTYIRKTTHLGVKTRLVSKKKELSDLVEELLFNWLKENDSFTA
jgi:hypothetical protein